MYLTLFGDSRPTSNQCKATTSFEASLIGFGVRRPVVFFSTGSCEIFTISVLPCLTNNFLCSTYLPAYQCGLRSLDPIYTILTITFCGFCTLIFSSRSFSNGYPHYHPHQRSSILATVLDEEPSRPAPVDCGQYRACHQRGLPHISSTDFGALASHDQ